MEALVAVSLAGNIVQFIDVSLRVLHGAKEIRQSLSGNTEDSQSLENVVQEMQRLSLRLDTAPPQHPSADEVALRNLAAECKRLSDQVLDIIQKCKPGNPKSKRSSAWSAAKNLYKKKEINEVGQRFDACRNQLNLQINHMMKSDTKARLVELATNAKNSYDLLKNLKAHSDGLRKETVIQSISPSAEKQLEDLLGLTEHMADAVAQRRILSSLAFSDMRGRLDTVEKAHFDTFHWVFQNDADSEGHGYSQSRINSEAKLEEEKTKSAARALLNNWLLSGTDIFHISGKIGAGKSTLMKYLCAHPETQAKLKKWAGSNKLIFANFFFWKPGTYLQKSLHGLMRSLLYDALNACPELIPSAFPQQWSQALSAHILLGAQFNLGQQNDEVFEAFSKLIENKHIFKNHRFCFFIDGLDEYEGTLQYDDLYMVNLLKRWTKNSDGAVKFCVSSREYNVFQNGLSADQRFRLQDLTRYDIEKYVHAQLNHMDDEYAKSSLLLEIVSRSCGIFLWVALVVKALRQCIEDGGDIARFQAELQYIPDELEGLFAYLLEPTLKSTREWTYQIYSLMLSIPADNWFDTLTLLDISFLDDYARNKDFATKENFLFHMGMDEATRKTRQDTTWKRVNGSCRGLVETKTTNYGQSLSFAHRSVSDFIQKQSTRNQMAEYTNGFQAERCLSQLYIAIIRLSPEQQDPVVVSEKIQALLYARHKVLLDHEPYEFLEFLDSIVDKQKEMDNLKHHYEKRAIWQEKVSRTKRLWHIDVGPFIRNPRIVSPIYHSVGHNICRYPHYRYVEWKLVQDDTITENIYSVLFFLASLFQGPLKDVATQLQLSQLAIKKTLTVNSLESIVSYSEKTGGVDATWVRFLQQAFCNLGTPKPESSDCELNLWAEIIIYLLKIGADPRVRAGPITLTSHMAKFRTPRSISDAKLVPDVTIRYYEDTLDGQETRFITLRKLVEIWNLPRKVEIFDLISKSEKRFAEIDDNGDHLNTLPKNE